uniref:CaMBD domain-containing protein n=1 Tax=Syphacia muris TaxID=451379 RepID=A0A0N5AEX0_9BILA
MSIGYGDIVPNTYCGRTLSITTGIVGAGVSSALIAVISRKLELSKPEKHVNNFMSDSKLSSRCRNAAASVLQNIWLIHKYKRSPFKGDELKLRQHQRKFLQSINDFRRIKWEQRRLQEKGNSLIDVGKVGLNNLQNDVRETLWEIQRMNEQLALNQAILTQQMAGLQQLIVKQQQQKNADTSSQKLAMIQLDNTTTIDDNSSTVAMTTATTTAPATIAATTTTAEPASASTAAVTAVPTTATVHANCSNVVTSNATSSTALPAATVKTTVQTASTAVPLSSNIRL